MDGIRILLSASALVWMGGSAAYSAWPPIYDGPMQEVAVTSVAVPLDGDDPARQSLGKLQWRGGIEIRSKDGRFGGLSDMLWEPACNRLLAVSDTGLWIVLEPEEKDGRLIGIRHAWVTPIIGADGKAAAEKKDADAEGMARDSEGATYVWFEQQHRAQIYPEASACRPESLRAGPRHTLHIPEMQDWPKNGGAEAVSGDGKRMLIFSEKAQRDDGGNVGLAFDPLGPSGKPLLSFSYWPPDGYSPTAVARVSNGNFLVLHRRASMMQGLTAILSEVTVGDPPGETVRGKEIARFEPPVTVDNMEALALREEAGRKAIYIASDDNFLPIQRTLLLKFAIDQE